MSVNRDLTYLPKYENFFPNSLSEKLGFTI
jgi:hypothetical protein